jgi:hypothetical protein
MKLIALFLVLISSVAMADEYVNGYVRSDGTYVAPHFQTSPNSNRYDNYSSQGNTNPYTGERGHERNEYSNPPTYNQPRQHRDSGLTHTYRPHR